MEKAVLKFLFSKSPPIYAGHDQCDWNLYTDKYRDKVKKTFNLKAPDGSLQCLIKVSVPDGIEIWSESKEKNQPTTALKKEEDVLRFLSACKIPLGKVGKQKWTTILKQIAGSGCDAVQQQIDEVISCIRYFLYNEYEAGFPLGAWDEKLTADECPFWRFKYVGNDGKIDAASFASYSGSF